MARLLEKYRNEVLPELMGELGRKNKYSLPRLEKICINMGVGAALQDAKLLEYAVADLTLLAGQKAVITKAKVSVSNFKVRAGWNVGCRVTLRGKRMYEFLDRLVNAAMPRIRDFRGVSPTAFDKQGNYSLGLEEQIIFPEINPDKVQAIQGMDITLVIRGAESPEDSFKFLSKMGMPFAQRQGAK